MDEFNEYTSDIEDESEEISFSEENAIPLEDCYDIYAEPDYVPEPERREEDKTPKFKTFPPAIRRSIEKLCLFLFFINTIAVFLFIKMGFNLYLFGILAFLDLFVGGLAVTMYLSGKNDEIITFEGYVYNTLERGIAGLNKSYILVLYNEDSDKYLCVNYSKYIDPETPVLLYMSKSANITMSDNGPMIENYLAIKFSKVIKNDELNEAMEDGKATVSDYLEDEEDIEEDDEE